MQNSRKNVVELNRFGRAQGPKGGGLLNECGEMMAIRLSEALEKSLKLAADELLELTDRVMGLEMRRLYDEAREFAEHKRGSLEAGFKQQFYQRFRQQCRREAGKAPAAGNIDLSQLSLVEPDELEESLASSNVANAINNICGEELFGLSKRIGVLLDDPELEYGDNPIGPELIGNAVMDALKAQEASVKIRLILVPLLNKHLPQQIRSIYQEINRHLVDKGILPTIRVGVGVRQHAAPTPSAKAEAASGVPAAAEAGGQDLFAILQQLLSTGGAAASPVRAAPLVAPLMPGETAAMPGPLAGLPAGSSAPGLPGEAAVPALMQALTRMQRGQTEGLPITLDAAQFASGQVNVLREIKGSAVAEGMGQMDAMTLDIVAMVFDYILDDRRIPDAMKALIGRLQIPVLKVAMLDRNFFSHKSHPARRLLDLLADASMGWDEEEGHDSGLYKKVDDLVQRVLNQFDEQLDVFSLVLEDFEAYLKEEKQFIAAATGKSAQVIHDQEQIEIARVVAHDMVQSHLFDRPVPELIRAFLFGNWEPWLATIHASSGESSPEWQQAVATMEDLIWSVIPKTGVDDRKKLIGMLPKLLKHLDEGMRMLGLADETRDQFFAGLVRCHAVAVKAATQGQLDPADSAALGMTVTGEPVEEPAWNATEPVSLDFEAVNLPAEAQAMEPDPALVQEISADLNEPEDVEEITISDVSWLAGGDWHEKDEYKDLVKGLKRGTWIEFQQEDGTTMRAKLAWTSPLKGIYLFTNRLGQRAMSIQADGLTAKFRDGQVKIIENVPLMDRAVNSLLEKLQHPGDG